MQCAWMFGTSFSQLLSCKEGADMTAGRDYSFLSFRVVRKRLQSWARLSHHTEAALKKPQILMMH